MIKKRITTYFVYIIFMTSFSNVSSMEWDCNSTTNTGTFTRSTNCTISGNDHVDLANMLEIVGTNTDINNLTTITAGTGTTGATILIGDGSPTGMVNQTNFGGIMIFAILILAGVIAHLIDRRLNQKLDLEQDQKHQDLNRKEFE